MPLMRCNDQKRSSLEEFYTGFIPDKVTTFSDAGTPMLKVLKLINSLFPETIIYGFTSHATLILQAEDDSLSDCYVVINGAEPDYYIEYLIPADKSPWHNAYVKGSTRSLDEFKVYLIKAMHASGGWPDSDELKRLYQTIDAESPGHLR